MSRFTTGTAKALIGKTIETYMQGFAAQSCRDKFVVGDIMSEYDYYKTLDEDCKDTYYIGRIDGVPASDHQCRHAD
jgi:hypothetical protein